MDLYFVELTGRTEDNYFKFEFCDDFNKLYDVFVSEDSFESFLEMENVNWNLIWKRKHTSLLTDNVQDLVDRSQLPHTNYDVYINKKQ